jgi:hypothetical protein
MNIKKTFLVIGMISLIGISFIGGNTFAKYLSSSTATGTLQIAKWNISEEFYSNGSATSSTELDLAKTYNTDTLVSGKIAPGTSGNFRIVIDASGTQTGVDYAIKFNTSESIPTNLIYIYNGVPYTLSSLEEKLKGKISTDETNEKLSFDIEWQWPYETFDENASSISGDSIDTNEGETIESFTLNVTITCTQEIPKEV